MKKLVYPAVRIAVVIGPAITLVGSVGVSASSSANTNDHPLII
jgi:hypothetical protein